MKNRTLRKIGILVPTVASFLLIPGNASAETLGESALHEAQHQIGTQYLSGGNHPGGFDCSGLVQWAYHNAGVDLPRTSQQQARAGHQVSSMEPGDIVVMYGTGHVGLYAGNGLVLHAPQPGQRVKYTSVKYLSVTSVRRV